MNKTHLLGALCACAIAFSVSSAHASILDFGIKAPTSGTLSHAGGDATLIGTGIDVDDIIGLGTPSNDNVLSICVDCILEFETGKSTGFWVWEGGGTITVKGGVEFADATPGIAAGSTLLTGTFDFAKVVDLGIAGLEFRVGGANFFDTKHEELTDFYGLPAGDYIGGLNISFSSTADFGTAFTSTQIFSGDIVNQPVPVPPAVWLFGSGLLGLVGIARRKAA